MFNAVVVAAIPPKPKAEILINFLLEVVINSLFFYLIKIYASLSLVYDKCHCVTKDTVT